MDTVKSASNHRQGFILADEAVAVVVHPFCRWRCTGVSRGVIVIAIAHVGLSVGVGIHDPRTGFKSRLAIGLHARLAVGFGTEGTGEEAAVGHARTLLRETRHATRGHRWHPALDAILKAGGDIVG